MVLFTKYMMLTLKLTTNSVICFPEGILVFMDNHSITGDFLYPIDFSLRE